MEATTSTADCGGGGPCSRWSGTPHDIMELIVRPLPLIDRGNMASVCKGWRSIIRSITPHNGLRYGSPCLASINTDDIVDEESPPAGIINLFFPFLEHKATHTIRVAGLTAEGAIIRSSREGWLLLSQDLDDDDGVVGMAVFFLNPLTGARIELPHLKNLRSAGPFSFSGSPLSPTCVVVALRFGVSGDELDAVVLWSCKRGDKQWKERVIVTHEDDITGAGPVTDLVFSHNSRRLYYLSERWELRGLNLQEKEEEDSSSWTVLKLPDRILDQFGDYIPHLAEEELINGDHHLLLVLKGRHGPVEVLRLVDSATTTAAAAAAAAAAALPGGEEDDVDHLHHDRHRWMPLSSLGDDRALFICEMGSLCTWAPTESTKNTMFFNIFRGGGGGGGGVSCPLAVGELTMADLYGVSQIPLSLWVDPKWYRPDSPGDLAWWHDTSEDE